MSNANNNMKNPESESPNMANLSGSVVSSTGSEEKKPVPLLIHKNNVSHGGASNSGSEVSNEPVTPVVNSFSLPKISTAATLAQNGKYVHVQPGSQNPVFIGTLVRSSTKGQDGGQQKVLLATVKSKDSSPLARLILPRTSTSNSQLTPTPTKQICRSFNMITCPQGTIMTPFSVKTAEGTNKIIQPNIIRQRTLDSKLMSGSGVPITGSLIVPGKSSPPALTLLKPKSPCQSGERPAKIMVVDFKENREKPPETEPLNSTISEPPKSPDLVPTDDKAPIDKSLSDKAETEKAPNGKGPADFNPDSTDGSDSEASVKITKPPVENDMEPIVIPDDEEPQESTQTNNMENPEVKVESESESKRDPPLRRIPSLLSSSVKKPVPALIARVWVPQAASSSSSSTSSTTTTSSSTISSSITSSSATPSPSVSTSTSSAEGRARKRKEILSTTAVSSPTKARPAGDVYENVKILAGAEFIDPFEAIVWEEESGVGTLPESHIQFITTDLGFIEVNASLKELERNRHGKLDEAEEIYCCVHCGCYGLLTEFFNESYCSVSCKENLLSQQQAVVNLDDLESFEEYLDSKKIKKKAEESNIKKPNEVSKDLKASKVVSLVDEDDVISVEDDIPPAEEPKPVVADVEQDHSITSNKRNCSSTDAPPNKLKKLVPKVKTQAKPSKSPKPSLPTQVLPPATENKSKIKLRPRSSVKVNPRYCDEDPMPTPTLCEEVVQDLDTGIPSSDNKHADTKKNVGFRWVSYLEQKNANPAWVKLFNQPFPSKPNRFKVGQKLEAIDPEHQSYFCLVTVAKVKGYRLKLHFDGYPPAYDFWVNADSPSIFPSDYCSSHKIPLHPPPGLSMRSFDWEVYLTSTNAKAAPASLFESYSSASAQPNLFKVDMKLEAVDRKNTFLVCVSTVAAVLDNRILIHFDSWGDLYDYWVDVSSPYIRPVGWCQKNGHTLTPPNGIKSENFSWKKYLKDTKSIAAPEKAFCLRPPIEFKKGMKIEAVDKRAPHLIRVATIAAVLPYQVNITFDGFPPHFGYWVDDDCPDIHPVGWASRSGHPLEPPPTEEALLNAACKTPGCMGQGYLKGTKKETHEKFEDCPYATENLTKDTALTDRLKWSNLKFKQKYGDEFCTVPDDDSDEESDEDIEGIRWSWLKVRQDLFKSKKRVSEEECNKKEPARPPSKTPINNSKRKREVKEAAKPVCSNDSLTDSEEIKKIFGPASPIPLVADIERESSIENIKTDHEDSEKSPCFIKDEPEIKFEPMNEESIFAQDPLAANENIEDKIKKEEDEVIEIKDEEDSEDSINDATINSEANSSYVRKKIKLENSVESEENTGTISYSNGSIELKVNRSSKAIESFPENEETTLVNCLSSHKSKEIAQHFFESMEVEDKHEDKLPLEEKNALRWTTKQVSQFTKPLITSCSQDCFLKEGIDGAGLLMMNKNDLLVHLGLSDTDAERVFSKISMLRQKVV